MNSLKFAGPNFSGSSLTGENNVEFSLGAMAREHLAEPLGSSYLELRTTSLTMSNGLCQGAVKITFLVYARTAKLC
jgi:hypothetical protein